MFYVGQKVVCINADENQFIVPNKPYRHSEFWSLREGEIYTISELTQHAYGNPCMKLVEIPDRSERDWGYNRARFRPLVEKKTDISIFKEMLNKTPVQLRKDMGKLRDAERRKELV
jgi:hypothetical protein